MQSFKIFGMLSCLFGAGLALDGAAQSPLLNPGPLETLVTGSGGFNEVQRNTGVFVNRVCFGILNSIPPRGNATLTSAQDDLRVECTRMVVTAGDISNPSNPSPAGNGLGTEDPAVLASALQRMAPEEMAARGRLAIEGSAKDFAGAIRGRLSALRAGSHGLAMNAIDVGPRRSVYAASKDPLGNKLRGGGASADRQDNGGRLGAFINGTFNRGDKDSTGREDGFDFDNASISGGVDYRFTDNVVAGGALSYSSSQIDLVDSQGSIDSKALGLAGYGTFYLGNFYLDGYLSYAKSDYDSTRGITYPGLALPAVNRSATGSTNGNQYTIGLGGGYDFALGAFTVTPFGRLEHLKLKVDGFDESGASGLDLHVDGQDVKSLQTAFGARASYAISTGIGVIIPQAGIEWNHEFENKSGNITARFVNDPNTNLIVIPTDDPDRDFFTVGLGVSAVFRNGWSAFANYEKILGLKTINVDSFLLGVRKEF
jgi:outer membrane lipase/esterase